MSCEGVGVFARLTDADLARLVFIETVDELNSGLWRYLFSDLPPARLALIEKVHKAYFQDAKNNRLALQL